MSEFDNFGEDSSDDKEPVKRRVYTETTDGEAGSVVVKAKSKGEAASKALEYDDFATVEDIERFERGSINHPFHEFSGF